MKKAITGPFVPLIVLLFSILPLLLYNSSGPATFAQTSSQYFPATGHTVRGAFWQYWQQHGGLMQQGYPISEELSARSPLTGQLYTMQYFERTVFEQHPENPPPYSVLLSLLGAFRYQAKYGAAGAPGQRRSTDNPRYFAETQHTIGGPFRTYWETHGGLAQQGYPLSDEFTEINALNGQPYTVQYFERAVYEWHPENAGTTYAVLLSQLGTFAYREASASTATPGVALAPSPSPTAVPSLPVASPTPRPAGPPTKRPAPSPTPTVAPPPGSVPALWSISMTSATEGWAAGEVRTRDMDRDLLMHFAGGRWEWVDSSFSNAPLRSISMISRNEGWALGPGGILHYHGGQWTQVFRPGVPDPRQSWPPLWGVMMTSADDGWAVGQAGFGVATMMHYTNGQWQDATPRNPDHYYLLAISMASSQVGWAVGTGGAILHRTSGQDWLADASPVGVWLNGIDAESANEAWAVGGGGTILHYVDGQWQQVASPVSSTLYSVKMVSPTEGWAVGDQVILHYGQGLWQRDPFPVTIPLHSLAMVSSTEGWVVGGATDFLHLKNGVWRWYNP